MAPFNARFAAVTTAFGLQAGHQELTASSPDDPTSPLNGLWDPNKNNRVAGYVFNELKLTERTKAQIAGRIEHVNLSGTTPAFIPELFDLNASPGDIGPPTARHLSFTPKSASVGLIQNLPGELAASITAQYVERAPKPAELFSRGAHDSTATFDIGNPNLGLETAKTIEIGLRRADGPLRFEATAYYTKFNGFIYRRLTGNTCEDVACVGSADPAFPLSSTRRSTRNATPLSAAASFRASWMSGHSMAASGALKISSTLCARPSATAPMFHGFHRCASAAACSGAMPTG